MKVHGPKVRLDQQKKNVNKAFQNFGTVDKGNNWIMKSFQSLFLHLQQNLKTARSDEFLWWKGAFLLGSRYAFRSKFLGHYHALVKGRRGAPGMVLLHTWEARHDKHIAKRSRFCKLVLLNHAMLSGIDNTDAKCHVFWTQGTWTQALALRRASKSQEEIAMHFFEGAHFTTQVPKSQRLVGFSSRMLERCVLERQRKLVKPALGHENMVFHLQVNLQYSQPCWTKKRATMGLMRSFILSLHDSDQLDALHSLPKWIFKPGAFLNRLRCQEYRR